MKTLTASLLAFAAVSAFADTPVDYHFDQVKRTVMLTTPKQEMQAAAGTKAQSGDKVHTGWFSYALIASKDRGAKFEIFSSTDVELAGNEPGVLLSLNRGTIHAMFDKIIGSEPRVVKTPGALLAVRGTQYSVEVDDKGRTTLGVFEGTVEVRSRLKKEPTLVHAGEAVGFSMNAPPISMPMPRNMAGAPRSMQGTGDHDHHGSGESHGGEPHGTPPPGNGHGRPGEGSAFPGNPGGHGTPPPPPPPPPPGGHS
ncbi:MAG TPA: FecR family protein [Thermoanaerobaculia bacterium]